MSPGVGASQDGSSTGGAWPCRRPPAPCTDDRRRRPGEGRGSRDLGQVGTGDGTASARSGRGTRPSSSWPPRAQQPWPRPTPSAIATFANASTWSLTSRWARAPWPRPRHMGDQPGRQTGVFRELLRKSPPTAARSRGCCHTGGYGIEELRGWLDRLQEEPCP